MADSLRKPLLQTICNDSELQACEAGTDVSDQSESFDGVESPGRSSTVTPRFGKQEILEGLETGEVPINLQSDFQTVLNTVNLYVGAGLLSMPYAMKIGGWLGLGVLALCASLSCLTGHFVSYACDALPPHVPPSYPALGKAAFGPPGEWILLGSVMLEFWGALSMCLIIVWRSLAIVLGPAPLCLPGTHLCLTTREVVVCLTLALALPIILIRSFSRLTSVAMSGVVSSTVLCTVMMAAWGMDPRGDLLPDPAAHEHATVDWMHLPVAAGIFIVSLSGHAGLPSLRRGMRTPSHFPWCLRRTFICIFLLYATMALFGYLYYGETAQVLVTSNLDAAGSLAGVVVLQWGPLSLSLSQALSLLVAMSVFTTVPPLTYVLGEIITDFTFGLGSHLRGASAESSSILGSVLLKIAARDAWEICFRLFVLGGGFVMALWCYEYLAKLESLVGGVLSMTASLLLPTLVFYSVKVHSLSWGSLIALRMFIAFVLSIPVIIVYFNM